MPDTMLGTEDIVAKKCLISHWVYILVREA